MPNCKYACDKDVGKVTLATQWKGVIENTRLKRNNCFYGILANADGVFRSACGKQYFIGTLNTTKLEAETECCKYGLKLMSVESYEELACLADMNAGLPQIK
jgi:hypothetical protein